LATAVAHRSMTVQDLNIPDTDGGPDALHAAPRFLEVKDVSYVQSAGINRSGLTVVAPAPIANSVSVPGFGFTSADFSSAGSLATNGHSRAFDRTPYEAR